MKEKPIKARDILKIVNHGVKKENRAKRLYEVGESGVAWAAYRLSAMDQERRFNIADSPVKNLFIDGFSESQALRSKMAAREEEVGVCINNLRDTLNPGQLDNFDRYLSVAEESLRRSKIRLFSKMVDNGAVDKVFSDQIRFIDCENNVSGKKGPDKKVVVFTAKTISVKPIVFADKLEVSNRLAEKIKKRLQPTLGLPAEGWMPGNAKIEFKREEIKGNRDEKIRGGVTELVKVSRDAARSFFGLRSLPDNVRYCFQKFCNVYNILFSGPKVLRERLDEKDEDIKEEHVLSQFPKDAVVFHQNFT